MREQRTSKHRKEQKEGKKKTKTKLGNEDAVEKIQSGESRRLLCFADANVQLYC